MLSFIDGVRHEYFPGLNQVSYDNINKSLNSWLTKGDSYLVTRDQPTDEFLIDAYAVEHILEPYVYDINRLSCAALESINNVYKVDISPKFLGWNITKYYYSSFFSAHCILRLLGRGLLRIDGNSIAKINITTRKYGFSTGSYSSGLYSLESLPNNQFRFHKNVLYNNSHEGLWRRFLDFLNEITPGIYSNLIQAEAQLVVSKIDELKEALCYTSDTTTNGNWLSKVRNLVNYSQEYGVWYPYKEYKTDNNIIFNDQVLCKEDPLNIDIDTYRGRDLIYFVRTCQLINAICFKILSDIKDRHPDNKSFVKHGIYKYHNLYLQRTTLNTGLIV